MEEFLRIIQRSKEKKLEKEFIPRLHYLFKIKFGITYDEFINMPIPVAFDLLRLIEEEREHDEKEFNKLKYSGYGGKIGKRI